MNDRLCGKMNKNNPEEFVVYVDFDFVLIIIVNKSNVENLK